MNKLNIKINFPFFYALLFYLIFITNIFLPPINLGFNFYFRFVDFIIPFAILLIIIDKNRIIPRSFVFFIILSVWISISMLINHNNVATNDFYEFYKIFKFAVIAIVALSYFKHFENHFDLFIKITFVVLFVLNLFQYYNIFHFHDLVEPFYDPSGIHWTSFGKNSLGEPGPKRMLGTGGNPNNNALIFLFYYCWFLFSMFHKNLKNLKWHNWLFLILSILAIILCQSRTAFAIILVITIIYFVFYHKPIKYMFIIIASTIFIMLFLDLVSKESTSYVSGFLKNVMLESKEYLTENLTNINDSDTVNKIKGKEYLTENLSDINDSDTVNKIKHKGYLAQNQSLRGRLDAWKFLLKMWSENPIVGYGPYKNFFYSLKLYSENEYILYLWRYGIIGFFLYIYWYLFPIVKLENKKIKLSINPFYLLFGLSLMAAALTNNPITHPMISVLLAISAGYQLALGKNISTDTN